MGYAESRVIETGGLYDPFLFLYSNSLYRNYNVNKIYKEESMLAELFVVSIVGGTGALTALMKSKYKKFTIIMIGAVILTGFFLLKME